MPEGFPVPTPADSNAPVDVTGGGFFRSSAGSSVDSSTVGSVSGPWFWREQELTLDYHRIPKQGVESSDPSAFSLSAQSSSHLVQSTELAAVIMAQTRSWVSTDYYVGEFSHLQTFSLQAYNKDERGNIYNDPSGFQLGPAGKISTKHPGLTRVLYDDTLLCVQTMLH